MRRSLTFLLLCAGLTPIALLGRAGDDVEVNWRIRREANERSQIMSTLHMLTDVHGPRLTGSPNLEAAGRWAIEQLEDWGLANGRLEPWEFGHPGWVNERFSGHILSPVKDQLTCEVLAWTPGTEGTVSGRAYVLTVPDSPTEPELEAHLAEMAGEVTGKVVLVGEAAEIPVTFNPRPRRRDTAEAQRQYDPDNPRAGRFPRPEPPPPEERDDHPILNNRQVSQQIDEFLVEAGALARVNDAGRDHGQIRAFRNRTYDITKAVPTVVMRNEDYGRIERILADGTPVELEFDIVNRVYPEGATAYNAIAEIPGTDKPDEVIMLGGHLDSWHAGTGATDNAIGVAVMMEAARILAALDLKPRRTIRVALWSGEEQGLLGSRAYVEEHFGSFEEPKPGYARFGGYFNIDSGTGRARGATVFGPPAAATVLREALAAFEDLGVMGAVATTSRRRGGSDHTSFNGAGLPGISMGQDPIQYQTHSWHTGLDTYERIVEEDAKASATVIAAGVYHLANREDALPRFDADAMPESPEPPPTTETQASAGAARP